MPTAKATSGQHKPETDSRVRILNAARTLYTKHGTNDVTFDDIAAAAKVSRRTIYRYFDSKHMLIQALVDEQALSFIEKMSTDLIDLSGDFDKLLEDYIVYLTIKGPQAPGRELLHGKSGGKGKAVHGGEFYFSSRLLHKNWKNLIAEPFKKAVARGELRDDIEQEQLLEWIGRVVFSFVQIPKPEQELRSFLKIFVLPALKPH